MDQGGLFSELVKAAESLGVLEALLLFFAFVQFVVIITLFRMVRTRDRMLRDREKTQERLNQVLVDNLIEQVQARPNIRIEGE